jgi:hypothetical protein
MKTYRVIPVSAAEWAVECHENDETVFLVRGGYASQEEAERRLRLLMPVEHACACA